MVYQVYAEAKVLKAHLVNAVSPVHKDFPVNLLLARTVYLANKENVAWMVLSEPQVDQVHQVTLVSPVKTFEAQTASEARQDALECQAELDHVDTSVDVANAVTQANEDLSAMLDSLVLTAVTVIQAQKEHKEIAVRWVYLARTVSTVAVESEVYLVNAELPVSPVPEA